MTYEQRPFAGTDGVAIKDASDLLGVPAPTLRSWERRYGLPTTSRSAGGHRRYTEESLDQLRLMRDQIASGRPAADSARWVRGLVVPGTPFRDRIDAVVAGAERLDPAGMTTALRQAHADLGLDVALDGVVLPAMGHVASRWVKVHGSNAEDHFTTEVVRGWLARVIASAPPPREGGWVLLAVGPRDLHTVGVEALAALLAHRHIGCRVLGPRTPKQVLVTATTATAAAAVVVASHAPTMRRPAVESLRAVAETGCPTFFVGNAFLFASSREGVPGTYLGETVTGAAEIIKAALPA